MIPMRNTCLYLLLCCIPFFVVAQSIRVDDLQDANSLVQKLTNSSGCLTITGASTKGETANPLANSFGIFDKNGSSFPFGSGVVLSTWSAKNSEGPFTNNGGGTNWTGDTDINSILGINSRNATVLEFDFIAKTNFLSFNYLFASNEYLKDNPCKYSDGLAILLKDSTVGNTYKNLAVLPDGTAVSSLNIHPAINYTDAFTNTQCPAKNEAFFGQFNTTNPTVSPSNYAGQTKVLTAQSDLVVGNQYHLKIVIANDRDNDNNSAIFVESGSFTSKINLGNNRLIANNNALCFGENLVLQTGLTGQHQWTRTTTAGTTILPETSSSLTVNQEGNYKVSITDSATNCIFSGEIVIEYLPSQALQNVQLSKCDENGAGKATFDLTSLKSTITSNSTTQINYFLNSNLTNEISNPTVFEKTSLGDQIVFVKATNNKGCSEMATITLSTISSQTSNVVLPSPIIKGFSGTANEVQLVPPTSSGNYEYSLDGIIYQSSPVFTGLSSGTYRGFIRNKTNCEFASVAFTLLDYPKFFTPNGDGFHDTWKIEGLNQYPKAQVFIFDRYGKLLKQMNSSSLGWNGTYNENPLPASDYWFRLVVNENQTVNGHFTLKR